MSSSHDDHAVDHEDETEEIGSANSPVANSDIIGKAVFKVCYNSDQDSWRLTVY
jgi:hypothetical protein